MACLQRGVKNVCKYWRQLICTVLEGGGGDRVRSSCLAGFLPLEESVNVPLQDREVTGDGGGGGLRGRQERERLGSC